MDRVTPEHIELAGALQSETLDVLAQALADAEARGLSNRDERCLQSDMQRIRERLAAERAWDEGFDEALMRPRGAVNPYRLPKGPTK